MDTTSGQPVAGVDGKRSSLAQSAEPAYETTAAGPTNYGEVPLVGKTSPGVQRIEAISKHITLFDRFLLFFGIFLVAYAYGLDGSLRVAYQPEATASYSEHSLLSTVTVVRSVIAAAAQPTAAKIADVFGRVELVFLSVIFYIVGTIVEATSTGVQAFVGGAILYQIGYTMIILLVEVIVADVTSLRSRLFFSYIPATPFLINTWVSGDVSQAVLDNTTWNWGIGMWAIIYPVCAMPLILSLYIVSRRAKSSSDLEKFRTPYQSLGFVRLVVALFWQLDVIGLILMIAVFILVLVPFTIAGGISTSWQQAKIIAPLVIGVVMIPVFILWEARAPHPLVPFKLLKDRAVWGALGVAVTLNTAWYLQGNYLYTVLQVAFDQSILSATRIAGIYSFTSVITGVIAGIVVFFVRRLKPFIVAGTILFMVAFGLLIKYRGGFGSDQYAGIIGAEILLGIAGGLFPYPAQASIQAATRHEHVAVITGLYLACYNIGSALGNTISGAVWTQTLPAKLTTQLAMVTNNSTLAADVYADPFTFILSYPVGTPQREAVTIAYRSTSRLLAITGICLCVPLIAFGFCTRNPRLTNTQSLPGAEDTVENDAEAAQAFEEKMEHDESVFQKVGRKLSRN